MQGFLLEGQTKATQCVADRRRRAVKAALLLQLLQRRVVLLFHQPPKSLLVAATQGGFRSTTMGFGSQRASVASPLQHPDDKRAATAEPPGNLPLGTFPVIDGRCHP